MATMVRPPRRLLQIALLLTSVAVCFAIGEWLWRAAVRAGQAAEDLAFSEKLYERVPGGELYALKANLDVVETFIDEGGAPPLTMRVRTNEQRLRRHVLWPPPPKEAAVRVLFVGDSYTFGLLVPDGETYAHRVEGMLTTESMPVFAINTGVPGYNTEQQLVCLRRWLKEFQPDHVVHGFVMNDAEPPIGVPTPLTDVYGNASSWLLEDGKRVLNSLCIACCDDHPLAPLRRPRYEKDYRLSWGAGATKASRCCDAIVAMSDACHEHEATFLTVVLPDFTKAFDATYPYHSIHAQVCARCNQHGIAVVDVLDDLMGMDVTKIRIPGDHHPNAAGHRLIAKALLPTLREQLRD
ncbi:MAG: hypothetical protein ACI9SE_003291 [Neolewinella sp.]|jgi:hypothetical protein